MSWTSSCLLILMCTVLFQLTKTKVVVNEQVNVSLRKTKTEKYQNKNEMKK